MDNPDLSEIITLDRNALKKSFFSRWKEEIRLYFSFLTKKKYDLVINLTEGDRGAFTSFITGANVRLGMESKKKIQKKCFTHFYKNCPKPRHSAEKNLDALRRLGIFSKEKPKLKFIVPEKSKTTIEKILKEKNLLNQKFLLFFPSSRWRFKCWPAEAFRELTRKINHKGYPVVFTLGKEDFEEKMIFQEITKDFSKDQVMVMPKISIQELGALVEKCAAMVSVDSFPAHLGAALQVKGVVLFGPTCEKTWGPWQNPELKVLSSNNFSCRPCLMDGCGGSKVSECLSSLSIEEVFQVLLLQLEK